MLELEVKSLFFFFFRPRLHRQGFEFHNHVKQTEMMDKVPALLKMAINPVPDSTAESNGQQVGVDVTDC